MSIFGYNSPFGRFMMRLVDVLLLSLLTLVCSLPIVTVGAAFSALYYVLLKMVRDTDNGIIRTYFKGFRDNFKRGTILWIIMAIVIAVFYMDFYLITNVAMDYSDLVRILLLIIGAFVLMVGIYIFPMQAQFENTVIGTLKKSFLVCIMNLPRSISLLLIMGCPIVILLLFPETVYFLPFLSIAAIPYLQTEILVRVFDKYIPEDTAEHTPGVRTQLIRKDPVEETSGDVK
ncbi:MAG: YesL family protein [Clostridiales bacterium]|nr:YesL family protein [Clostridiales bacterium]